MRNLKNMGFFSISAARPSPITTHHHHHPSVNTSWRRAWNPAAGVKTAAYWRYVFNPQPPCTNTNLSVNKIEKGLNYPEPSPSPSLTHSLSLPLTSSIAPSFPLSLPLSFFLFPTRALRFAREKVPCTYRDFDFFTKNISSKTPLLQTSKNWPNHHFYTPQKIEKSQKKNCAKFFR